MHFTLKNLRKTNKTLDKDLLQSLNFTVVADGDDWKIPVSEFDKTPDLFSTELRTPIKNIDSYKRTAYEQFEKTDNISLHDYILSKGPNGTQIKHHNCLNSWLYAKRIPITLNPVYKIEPLLNEFIDRLHQDLFVRELVSFKKCFTEFSVLFQLIKFAYLTNSTDKITDVEDALKREAFFGIELSGFELANYIEPFLICAPYMTTLPIQRFTSSHFFIFEKILTPHIADNMGIGSILIHNFLPIVRQDKFELFTPTSLQTRRYISFLTEKLNHFYRYQLHPKNSSINGAVNYNFLLQQVCTTLLIMTDFAALSSNVDPVARLYSSVSILDKLANYKREYKEKFMGKVYQSAGHGDTIEFTKLLSDKLLEDASKKIRHSLTSVDSNFARELADNIDLEIQNLKKFSPHHQLEESLRIVRNLKHGAFINQDKFFTLFTAGAVKIPPSHITIIYALMLYFIIDTEDFLRN